MRGRHRPGSEPVVLEMEPGHLRASTPPGLNRKLGTGFKSGWGTGALRHRLSATPAPSSRWSWENGETRSDNEPDCWGTALRSCAFVWDLGFDCRVVP